MAFIGLGFTWYVAISPLAWSSETLISSWQVLRVISFQMLDQGASYFERRMVAVRADIFQINMWHDFWYVRIRGIDQT